jgi:hypothetical protein
MITIPIRSVANETDGYDESSTEWALIELNGELIPPKLSRSHDTNDNNEAYTIELGSIHFDSKVCLLLYYCKICHRYILSQS